MIEDVNLREHILLDTNVSLHVALSVRGSGILAKALAGKYDGRLQERAMLLAFAYRVVSSIGLLPADERQPTPQILVDAADTVIADQEASLTCTTWKWLPEGMELCSIGANTVLVSDGTMIRQVIAPQTAYELLKSQGEPLPSRSLPSAHIAVKALGPKLHPLSGTVEDVRVAIVPFSSRSTIAIVEDVQVAQDILKQQVSGSELPSFIQTWDQKAKKVATSVLISL